MKRAPKIPAPLERDSQRALFAWAELATGRHPELANLFAIPNAGGFTGTFRSNMLRVIAMKREGVKSGVPDICLAVARGGYHALYIELKREGGGRAGNDRGRGSPGFWPFPRLPRPPRTREMTDPKMQEFVKAVDALTEAFFSASLPDTHAARSSVIRLYEEAVKDALTVQEARCLLMDMGIESKREGWDFNVWCEAVAKIKHRATTGGPIDG